MYSQIKDAPALVDDFITYKKTLGFKYDTETRIMATFKTYSLKQAQNGVVTLDEQFMEGWCQRHANESRKSQSNRISLLKQFAIYLNNKGYCIYSPKSIYNVVNKAFIPYIFTHEEIKHILEVVDSIPYHAWTNIDAVFPVLFRILYGCGLRINEALSLKLKDIDTEKGILTIYHAKNDKSRLVVMSPSLKDICTTYVKLFLQNGCQEDYVFARRSGKKRSSSQVSGYFKIILWKAQIPYGGRGVGPRLHDVRHTFCCHSLKQMIDKGMDMYCALPVLSAYLGHSGIRSTEKYLRLTKSVYPDITADISAYTAEAYPEVYYE